MLSPELSLCCEVSDRYGLLGSCSDLSAGSKLVACFELLLCRRLLVPRELFVVRELVACCELRWRAYSGIGGRGPSGGGDGGGPQKFWESEVGRQLTRAFLGSLTEDAAAGRETGRGRSDALVLLLLVLVALVLVFWGATS